MKAISIYTIINQIEKLSQRERRNAAEYIALNPADADRRRTLEAVTLAAYHTVLTTLTE